MSDTEILEPYLSEKEDKPESPSLDRSSSSSGSSRGQICRICHSGDGPDKPLISPCQCAGSLRFVHQSCVTRWIKSSYNERCEICKVLFVYDTKVKPFKEWELVKLLPEDVYDVFTTAITSLGSFAFFICFLILIRDIYTYYTDELNNRQGIWCMVLVCLTILLLGSLQTMYALYLCRQMGRKIASRWKIINCSLNVLGVHNDDDVDVAGIALAASNEMVTFRTEDHTVELQESVRFECFSEES